MTSDSNRGMRLEVLQQVLGRYGPVTPINDGELIALAEYHHQDKKSVGIQSMRMWELQDHEYIYIFSGDTLDMDAYRRCMQRSLDEAGDKIVPDKKMRAATVTTLLIFDNAAPDALKELKAHDHKVYHKMSLNGWSIHRVGAVFTDDKTIATDKRAAKLDRRLMKLVDL